MYLFVLDKIKKKLIFLTKLFVCKLIAIDQTFIIIAPNNEILSCVFWSVCQQEDVPFPQL